MEIFINCLELPDTFRLYSIPKWLEANMDNAEYQPFINEMQLNSNPVIPLGIIDDGVLSELLSFNLVELQNGALCLTHKYNVLFRPHWGYGGPQLLGCAE